MKVTEIPAKPKEEKVLRVAAYARVSRAQDASFHSLEAQTDYYETYINKHPGWKLVTIYSDNGISGTLINRPEFQRMVQDCREGKIDLVVTKSVTRFARNTVVLLETIRELKSLGIDCYFEKENMHSISPDGELLLTLLAMYAEEEARSVSENIRWKARKKFEAGQVWSGGIIGYRYVDGMLVVVPEEAEIVKQIFSDYLSGMGLVAISRKCIESYPDFSKRYKWTPSSIKYILTNEKYAGNLLLQKTYLEDFRTKKRKRNHGEVTQYYVENAHEAIIDRETFNAVQKTFTTRNNPSAPSRNDKNPFKGLVFCDNCGSRLVRRSRKYKGFIYDYLCCYNLVSRGRAFCDSKRIPEEVLIEKTQDILGVTALTSLSLTDFFQKIIASNGNRLTFVFKDGRTEEVIWENRNGNKYVSKHDFGRKEET